ncbi:acyl-CoA synthetase (AMP-forming)/AMP-acid ligase II [Mycobacterium sp. URHB0021]
MLGRSAEGGRPTASVATPREDELIAYARARLGGFKLPKSVDFAEALPRTPSGKLLRVRCASRIGQASADGSADRFPPPCCARIRLQA